VKLSNAEKVLTLALVAYIVCDVLLTPPARLETHDPALVTSLGVVALVLLFIGLPLSILALVLLFRGSGRVPMIAIVAALLYFPAPLVEVTGHFSSLKPPAAIASIEAIQAVVAIILVGVSLWVLRSRNRAGT
jgi:hypothetical protein